MSKQLKQYSVCYVDDNKMSQHKEFDNFALACAFYYDLLLKFEGQSKTLWRLGGCPVDDTLLEHKIYEKKKV